MDVSLSFPGLGTRESSVVVKPPLFDAMRKVTDEPRQAPHTAGTL